MHGYHSPLIQAHIFHKWLTAPLTLLGPSIRWLAFSGERLWEVSQGLFRLGILRSCQRTEVAVMWQYDHGSLTPWTIYHGTAMVIGNPGRNPLYQGLETDFSCQWYCSLTTSKGFPRDKGAPLNAWNHVGSNLTCSHDLYHPGLCGTWVHM